MDTGTKYGVYLLYLFLIASAFCTFVLLHGFLKWVPSIPEIAKSRFASLREYYDSLPEVESYIAAHARAKPQYSQVYWMIVDGFAAYALIPAPGDRT
ncbi:MAG: hypothetical protein P4M11_03980 [Candidatus Pacebacteria bacterium]|nr:hypothetical protein [Candidatus Paceibacterota bacterium]